MDADVIVVGAGVIGTAIAWRAASAGHAVIIVDPGADDPRTDDKASLVAAGMLGPVSESVFGEQDLLNLNLHAIDRFPSFNAELERAAGQETGLRTEGTLAVAYDNGDLAALDRLTDFRHSIGLKAERLDARECRKREPFLAPSTRGGVFAAGDLSVDNRRYLAALRAAAAKAGVRPVRAAATRVAPGRVTLSAGSLSAGSQPAGSLSAGSLSAGSQPAGSQPAGTGPTGSRELTAARVVVAARPRHPLPRRRASSGAERDPPGQGPAAAAAHPSAYAAVPLPHRAGLGAGRTSTWCRGRTASWWWGPPSEERADTTVTAGGVYELLRDAHELVPAAHRAPLAEAGAGLRPAAPDNASAARGDGLTGGCSPRPATTATASCSPPSPRTRSPRCSTGKDAARRLVARSPTASTGRVSGSDLSVTVNGEHRECRRGHHARGPGRRALRGARGDRRRRRRRGRAPPRLWPGTALADGDRVEILTAVQGG